MNGLALDLATYINATKSGTVYANYPVSANFTPDNIPDSITVIDTGGYSPDRYHGSTEPQDRKTVQIIVRSTQASSAHLVAMALYHDLDGLYGIGMNNSTYVSLEAVNPPVYIGVATVSTKGQAHSYSLNMYGTIMRS